MDLLNSETELKIKKKLCKKIIYARNLFWNENMYLKIK